MTPVYFSLVNALRGLASLLVVYAHLIAQYSENASLNWSPYLLIHRFVETPFGIIQSFGWFGVVLFFFISGFVVTHASTRETTREFAVKRVLRIYPPLIFSILLILLLSALGPAPVGSLDPGAWLLNATLVNYVVVPQVVLVGVAWTLAIEMIFYLWMVLLKAIRIPVAAVPWVLIGVTTIVVIFSTDFGSSFFLFSVLSSYLPLLLMGQLVYLVRMRRLSVPLGILGLTASLLCFVRGIEVLQPQFLDPANSYASNAALAFAVFLTVVALDGRIATPWPLDFLAKRSYSLYLIHGPIGLLMLDLLFVRDGLPFFPSLTIALAVVAAFTELSFRVAEQPSIRLARQLTTAMRRPSANSVNGTI